MSQRPRGKDDLPSERSHCVARSVVAAMAENPSLEAVTIDRSRQRISLATLGQVDVPKLTANINATFERAQAARASGFCVLLQSSGDCHGCTRPFPELQTKRISISHEGDSTTIARVRCQTAPKFWRWRDIPLPKVVPREVELAEDERGLNEWKFQLAGAIACGVFALGGYLLHHQPAYSISAYLIAYLAGSWFAAEDTWKRLREGAIDVHFLMLAVAVGSASIGAWGEGAMLLFLFSFSGALEHYAMGRTQREIRALFREAPKCATVVDASGHEREMPVESLRPGMRLLLKPGAQFPVDSELVKGRTAADESNLTGEAVPVEKSVGDTVFAGTMNLWGAVEAFVLRPAAESSLQKIISLIREAQHQKAPSQKFTDKFGTYYTYIVLALSLVMFFVWWLVKGFYPFRPGAGEESAFYHAMTLLVVASPCALVLSIPSAVLAAIASGARHGILFRGGAAVEKMAEISLVALDKTGTLTTGELCIERIESFPAGREREVGVTAFSLERLSSHPLARAITRYGKQQGFEPLPLEHFESLTGHGLRALKDGEVCILGRREWVLDGVHQPLAARTPPAEPGLSEIWVAHGDLVGRLILRDDVRSQSKGVLNALRREELRTVVLTGDRKAAAEHLCQELAVDEIRAELRPEQKLEIIREFTKGGKKVAMVGDGVNDAPSLAAAHIGVAMGARGSDAALEQADVVLMHDRLENFLSAFRLSQRARTVIRQNLVISLGTVAVLVTFALLGKIPLTIGVVGHEGSTVLVVMNSLRLLFGANRRN